MATKLHFLVLGLMVGWSTANASPHHRRAKPAAVAAPTDDTRQRVPDTHADTHPALDTHARAKSGSGWQLALGPYVWASAVESNVSFGPLTAGVDLGFVTLARHTRYGAELAGELRRGRFAISGDLMYGAAAVSASTDLLPVSMTLTGNASSLMIDAAAGYEVIGDEASVFSLEARAGLRYQRTVVSAELGVAGFALQSPELVDAGSDAILGARATVRPGHGLSLAGMFDTGVVGASDRTWSATVEAAAHLTSRLVLAAGWRTLTLARANVDLQLRGPRVSLQLIF